MCYPSFLKNSVFFSSMLLAVSIVATMPVAQAISLTDVFSNAGQLDKKKPLPVHQAFAIFPTQTQDKITVRFEITDGYYLYQDKLSLVLPTGITATPFHFDQTPEYVDDPDFGRVPVFTKTVTGAATLIAAESITDTQATVKWQGCAKAGLCYPPEKTDFVLQPIMPISDSVKQGQSESIKVASTVASSITVAQMASQPVPNVTKSAMISVPTTMNHQQDITIDTVANPSWQDPFGLQQHTTLALLLLFLAGLGLAFTPCVLPMLPIVANIVARQHRPTAKKGLLLTGGYGLGVATSYGLLGALIAIFGQSLGIMNWLQNPVILLSFAGLFVLLGLYMLDMLPVRLPARLAIKLQGLTQIGENKLGSVTGSFITGFFSALVVSPCVSAPLAGALAGVATVGNPVLGFLALFMLGLGLSTPLILLGATQGNFMPKAGEWMTWVKTGFALLMFAVALLMIERVFMSSLMLALWALWFAVVAVWAWQWAGRGQLLSKAVGFSLGVWTVCLLVGVAIGSQDSWQPLKSLTSQSISVGKNTQQSITVETWAELETILRQNPNVLVDVTADWCIECRIMDKTLFANPPSTLAKWQVVKLDVTDNTPESKAVYEKLQVFGPPVLLYFQQGKLVERQDGETKRNDFESVLSRL